MMTANSQSDFPQAEESPEAQSLSMRIRAVWQSMQQLMATLSEMITLESQLTIRNLIGIISLSFLMIIVVFSSWIISLLSLSIWLVNLGWAWHMALLMIAAINLGLIIPAYFVIMYLSKRLGFQATKRQLNSFKNLLEMKNEKFGKLD